MRLISFELAAFRRFKESSAVRIAGPLTAVVGPNEAGKSSILHALTLLNNDEPINPRDITRHEDEGRARVAATFVLDDEDRAAMSHIPGGDRIERCTYIKQVDGYIKVRAEPPPEHDTTARGPILAKLEGLEELATLRNAHRNKGHTYTHDQLKRVRTQLGSSEPLGPTGGKAFTSLADALDHAVGTWAPGEEHVDLLADVIQALRDQADHEREPAPWSAAEVLKGRRPEFLAFTEKYRDLRPRYEIARISESDSPALWRLLDLAELDIAKVQNAIARDRPSDHMALLNDANEVLGARFGAAWNRDQVVPYLLVSNGELHLTVKNFDGRTMSPVDERSDGLRWFIAMLAFVSSRDAAPSRPILLVDEAETHLSYDAQAKLLDVLAGQQIAQAVIYTTHSAGCLPPDLGTGVKPVLPQDDMDRSRILNSFWQQDPKRPGFTSLMLAMGASALAFTPSRNVLIGEGPSECILLPTLLREATGRQSLDFQVAPGLSDASEASFPLLLDSGARVGFLCDADEGGRGRASWLRKHGVSDASVLSYDEPDVALQVETIEDLVDANVYVTAVNNILDRYDISGDRVEVADVPARGRATWLSTTWLAGRGLDPGSVQKTTVCQEVVLLAYEQTEGPFSVVADEHLDGLAALHDRASRAFEVWVRPHGSGGA